MKTSPAQCNQSGAGFRCHEGLRELRSPLVALAVLALLFQLLMPVIAAKAGPQTFGEFSICFGAGDGQKDGQGGNPVYAGGCVCGPTCQHGNCGGCQHAGAGGIAFSYPVCSGKVSPLRGPPDHCDRPGDRLARSRAPPVIS